MIALAGKLCAGVAVAAAIGLAAAPAGATTSLPLEPATTDTAQNPHAAPVFVPQTGSAGIYNSFTCTLHTMSASVPCIYT
ncbi:hypothetical protein [Nocardia australiensis]|uniref:hypothetical protein n=1 Tax=Nocardia australiensis TaxID=2887191 RepID=UPI001D15328D|nr:hypothetical protein [Nocardia australiensis]